MSDPLLVLFVCTANICRSPFMELTARRMTGDDPRVEFASAGTHGRERLPMDEVMAATLPPGAADRFWSRPVSSAMVGLADLVLTAEGTHRTWLLQEDPQLVRSIFTLGQFADAAARFPDLRGRELIAAIAALRTVPDPRLDVRDPYRRGKSACEVSAGTISTMLSVIVPMLAEED